MTVYNLQITIVEDNDRHSTTKREHPERFQYVELGKLSFAGAYGLEEDALEGVCSALLALFPNDPVLLRVRYDIENH
jgi:hypothetical protein